jgi:hypothetical protein
MFRAAAFGAVLASALCVLPASAETAPNSTDSHITAALDLLAVTNAKATLIGMIDPLVPQIVSQVRARYPHASSAAIEQFQTAFREELMRDLDSLLMDSAKIYEERFTESELRALAAFYGSEAGKTYMPIILKQSVPVGAAWSREAGTRAAERAVGRLRANGVEL